MVYNVVEITKRNYSNGSHTSEKDILCSFSEKDDAEDYIGDQYFIMLGLGYSATSIRSNVYKREYEIQPYDILSSRSVKVEEIVRFVVSEGWGKDGKV